METEEALHSETVLEKQSVRRHGNGWRCFLRKIKLKSILLNFVIVKARENYDVQVSPVNQGMVINHFTLHCHFWRKLSHTNEKCPVEILGPTRHAKHLRSVGIYIHLQCWTANKQSTTQRRGLPWITTKLQHPACASQTNSSCYDLAMVFQSVFDPRAPPTWRISEQATHHQYLRCVPSLNDREPSIFMRCSGRRIKRKARVAQDFADQPRIHFARGKARRMPITRTITACQVTDYSTKITYCFQTVPSSSEKAAFAQAVFLSLTTLSLRSWMPRLNKQDAQRKTAGLLRA